MTGIAPSSRRRLLRRLAVAGALPWIPGLIQSVLANGNKPVAPGIYRVSGTVTVNGQPAREGMLINRGDTIQTGPNSEVVYVVGQDAYLQRDNSLVAIGGDSLKSGLRMLSGKLLAVFGKGPKQLETSVATIGIRGTGCYIEATESRMYFCLCYGEADCVPAAAPDKTKKVITTHHETPLWISSRERDNPITPAPMINHTDAELILLEGLVGRYPPFYGKSEYRY